MKQGGWAGWSALSWRHTEPPPQFATKGSPITRTASTTRLRRRGPASASVLVALLLLAACAPGDPALTPKPTQSSSGAEPASPTSTPKPALPQAAGDELVRATAQASAANGAILTLSMTVHYPVAYDTVGVKAVLDYLASVGDTSGITADPALLASTFSSLQVSGVSATDGAPIGTAWPASSSVLLDLGPNNSGAAFGLPLARVGATIGSYLVVGSGTGHAVTRIEGVDAVDPATWAQRFTYYGFSGGTEQAAAISNCTIEITPLAHSSPGIEGWQDLWPSSHLYCVVGVGD